MRRDTLTFLAPVREASLTLLAHIRADAADRLLAASEDELRARRATAGVTGSVYRVDPRELGLDDDGFRVVPEQRMRPPGRRALLCRVAARTIAFAPRAPRTGLMWDVFLPGGGRRLSPPFAFHTLADAMFETGVGTAEVALRWYVRRRQAAAVALFERWHAGDARLPDHLPPDIVELVLASWSQELRTWGVAHLRALREGRPPTS